MVYKCPKNANRQLTDCREQVPSDISTYLNTTDLHRLLLRSLIAIFHQIKILRLEFSTIATSSVQLPDSPQIQGPLAFSCLQEVIF